MYFLIALIVAAVVYVVTFKHEYTKEEFSKVTPLLIAFGVVAFMMSV